MKLCAYCGLGNPDDATHCSGCGTGDFKEVNLPLPTTKNIEGEEKIEITPDEPVELQRCRDEESVAEVTRILDSAGIAYNRSSLPAMLNIGIVGASYDDDVIISVPAHLFPAARAAMESEYLKTDLPADHFLRSATDDELAEIVGQSPQWSPFDVAHARRLIGQRGIDLKKVEDKKEEHLRQLQRGKPASKRLLFLGWLFSALGGLIGVGIAWSLVFMKEETPDGKFFTYDEKSREIGAKMLVVALAVLAVSLLVRLLFLFTH